MANACHPASFYWPKLLPYMKGLTCTFLSTCHCCPWLLLKKMLFACQLGQWERLVQQEQRHKRKAKSASVGCNAIRFRWQWVSMWEWCEVSGIWIPQPNSLGCENNWQKHESVSKNTRGSHNPWPDGDGQGGMVVGVLAVMFTPLVSGNGYSSISPCATFGLCIFPGVRV